MTTTPPTGTKIAYSIVEVAQVTGLSRSKIYEEMDAGRLMSRKAGKRRIILHADLVSYLTSLPQSA